MGVAAKKVNPEDFILSALSPEDRLNAAFDVSREAFRKSTLSMKDIDNAVKSVRRTALLDLKTIEDRVAEPSSDYEAYSRKRKSRLPVSN